MAASTNAAGAKPPLVLPPVVISAQKVKEAMMRMNANDTDGALVWLRRPAPGARTSTTVLAVCNLSSHNLHLGLDRELERLHVPYGGLRTLATSKPVPFEDSQDMVLPPGGAFLGEFSR